jgi:hypothetical protein
MAAIDDITQLAQDQYFAVNGAENDDTGADATTFVNNYIRAFNMWVQEYETEAYWNVARVDDFVLGTIANTTDFSFTLDATYRTPIFDQNKYLKFILDDGTVIAKFKLVDPNQRQVDDSLEGDDYLARKDRATFIPAAAGGGTVVLSRVPTTEEVGAEMVLDVVKKFPLLTSTDATVLTWIYNNNIATLGVSKNVTLSDVTKVSLSPSFAQKYSNELNKALNINASSNDIDEMRGEDYGYIGGIW